MTTAMPDYVRQVLVDAATLTPDGLGRGAQMRECHRCRQWVIVGLDHRRCALTVTCDPVSLDPFGEAVALLTGRVTYELWGREIERRDHYKISGGQHKPVIATHDCAIARTPSLDIVRLFIPARQSTESDTPCPF